MKLSDIFFTILYGGALILIIYFVIGLFYKPGPSTIVIYNEDETPVYQEPIYPWSYGLYNYWPYWSGWWSGGGDGGYGYYKGPRWGSRGGHTRHWGGGGHRPFGGASRGANIGAPRSGGGNFSGGARMGSSGGGRGGGRR